MSSTNLRTSKLAHFETTIFLATLVLPPVIILFMRSLSSIDLVYTLGRRIERTH